MADQFDDQGGFATMDPSLLNRFVTSKFMTRRASAEVQKRRRETTEKRRRRAGAPHRVEYFHQVEDGYSHLAAQLLEPLLRDYDIELVCHLVTVENDRNLPEPDLLLPLSYYDSAKIAPHYGLGFPERVAGPDADRADLATRILASADGKTFAPLAVKVGDALWNDDDARLDALARSHGSADAEMVRASIARGTARRAELKHYSGAMFFYAGEWYWGADRFYLLEEHLSQVGARKKGASGAICPRPAIENGPLRDHGTLTLEIYASLRSPYTAVIFDKAVQLANDTGVKMVMRPVLPMVMRGVPATFAKGLYIFTDAAREARALGLDFGPFYDPIGQPVRNCYSLYPWACSQGKGTELLSSFLRRAFFEGVNTLREQGLAEVVEKAGLDWAEAKGRVGHSDWEAEMEAHRVAMYDFGCWGVPSFRLLDARGESVLGLWGQDRLWLISREIQRLLNKRGA